MKQYLSVKQKKGYIEVHAYGPKDVQFSNKLWKSIADLAEKNKCFKVLGIANSPSHMNIFEGYSRFRLLQTLNIDFRYRIAWVEQNENEKEIVNFIAMVCENRGISAKICDSIEDAKEYLGVS